MLGFHMPSAAETFDELVHDVEKTRDLAFDRPSARLSHEPLCGHC